MEMTKISLARAFILRKRLRDTTNNLEREFEKAPNSHFCKEIAPPSISILESDLQKAEEPYSYKGMSYDEIYDKFEKSLSLLSDFNSIIDKVNADKPRALINKIESLKSRIPVINYAITENKAFKDEERSYNSSIYNNISNEMGVYTTRIFEKDTNKDWEEELSKVKKEILKLEDELSEVNTTIRVDVPTEIINFIEDSI